MAKKDPAFLFYPKDWIQGTAKMMPEEKGVYIDLLAHQHQDRDLPNDTRRLSRIVGLSESEFFPIWETIKDKFTVNNNNRLVNRKLTELMTERLELSKKNKIIGTMASVFRLTDAPYDIKFECKKNFNYQDFWEVKETELTESITEWFTKRLAARLKSIGNGNAIGNGNLSNNISSDTIISRMCNVWKRNNPNYQWFETDDYPALLEIAYKIAKAKGWEKHEVVNGKLDATEGSWKTISEFIKTQDFYRKLDLKAINKQWTGLYQTMTASKTPIKKEADKPVKIIRD